MFRGMAVPKAVPSMALGISALALSWLLRRLYIHGRSRARVPKKMRNGGARRPASSSKGARVADRAVVPGRSKCSHKRQPPRDARYKGLPTQMEEDLESSEDEPAVQPSTAHVKPRAELCARPCVKPCAKPCAQPSTSTPRAKLRKCQRTTSEMRVCDGRAAGLEASKRWPEGGDHSKERADAIERADRHSVDRPRSMEEAARSEDHAPLGLSQAVRAPVRILTTQSTGTATPPRIIADQFGLD